MPDRPSGPAVPPPSPGKITRIAVTYTVNTADGPRHTFHGLTTMQRHIRPERMGELIDYLAVICEELLARRPQPLLGIPPTVSRLPFAPSPGRPGREPCRDLLAAVRDALDCPQPADHAGEGAFLRLRSDRARLALAALGPVLADPESGPAQMTAAARSLREDLAGYPADGYRHSPLST